MSKFLENVAIVNSAFRTVLAVVLVGGIGIGGWYGYATYNAKDLEIRQTAEALAEARDTLVMKEIALKEKDATIDSLHVDIEKKNREIDRLGTALRLLKVDHRIARLTVVDQAADADSGELTSLVEFQELNESGEPIDAPKQFRIAGDIVYVDAWVVKFDDKYVEKAEIDRSTSLVLFRRIFGERQKPLEGFPLDQAGSRPGAYSKGGEPTDLEKRIWGDFWSVANDEVRQAELGIRAAHGEAPSLKVQKGKSYRIEVRASGGLSFDLEGEAKRPDKPAA